MKDLIKRPIAFILVLSLAISSVSVMTFAIGNDMEVVDEVTYYDEIMTTSSNFVWHATRSERGVFEVGYWEVPVIRVNHRTVGSVTPEFQFNAHMAASRDAWSAAIGVPIVNHSLAIGSNIVAYGGTRDGILLETGVRLGPTHVGAAYEAERVLRAGVFVGGIIKRVYAYSGFGVRARIFVVEQTHANAEFNRGFNRKITMHELGHALGWLGHKVAHTSAVMHGNLNRFYTLVPNEITHLRQFYDAFR